MIVYGMKWAHCVNLGGTTDIINRPLHVFVRDGFFIIKERDGHGLRLVAEE